MMTVEILLATYNGEKYIEALLESITKQTYSDIALLIRDDGSTDQTVNLINRFLVSWDKPWKWVKSSVGGPGVINNFSALMYESTAQYVMFADQDDYWFPDKVEKSLAELKRLETVHGENYPILVHSDLEVVDANLNRIHHSFWEYSKIQPSFNGLNRLFIENVITGCTMLMNRPLLELALPIPKEAIMHDGWIGLVASAFGTIGIIYQSTLSYRQHDNNQIGAMKRSLNLKHILGRIYRFRSRTIPMFSQARAFYEQYSNQLPGSQRQMVEDFISLPECSFFQKKIKIVEHQFFTQRVRNTMTMFCLL